MRQILEAKAKGLRTQDRPRQELEVKIKTDLDGIGKHATKWKEIMQDRRRGMAVVRAVISPCPFSPGL